MGLMIDVLVDSTMAHGTIQTFPHWLKDGEACYLCYSNYSKVEKQDQGLRWTVVK